MSKRWLVISHEAANSGAPRMLLDLLRGVRAARGPTWDCRMLFSQGGPLMSEFAKLGPVRRLSHPWTEGTGTMARVCRHVARRLWLKPRHFSRQVAEWQAQGGGVIFSNTGINGRLLAALPEGSGRVVSYVHELEYGLRRFNRPADLATTLARSDRFLAVSTAVTADLTKLGVDARRVRLVPNFLPAMPAAPEQAVARDEICRRLHLAPETRLVAGCGHIERVKGPDLFVAMARLVAARAQGPVAFVWLGRAADRRLARELRSVARGAVRFVGEVSDANRYFAASELVVVTSRSESFSRVALEAGALGRPVLAFAAARGPADILAEDSLVRESTPEAMAAAVIEGLDDPDSARRRGEELRERIAGGFLAEHWIDKLISFVEGEEHA